MNQATITPTTKSDHHAALLKRAAISNGGSRDWRQFKEASAREILELAERTQRMDVLAISLEGDFRLAYEISMPVPRVPKDGRLRIGNRALFDLMYQENWRWESPPSFLPLSVLQPDDVFHPNCRPAATPPIDLPIRMPLLSRAMVCLGQLPPCTAPKEIVLLGYFALTLQDRILDEFDPAGVFNPEASQYYRDHPEHLPLTSAGLLDPWSENAQGDL